MSKKSDDRLADSMVFGVLFGNSVGLIMGLLFVSWIFNKP